MQLRNTCASPTKSDSGTRASRVIAKATSPCSAAPVALETAVAARSAAWSLLAATGPPASPVGAVEQPTSVASTTPTISARCRARIEQQDRTLRFSSSRQQRLVPYPVRARPFLAQALLLVVLVF